MKILAFLYLLPFITYFLGGLVVTATGTDASWAFVPNIAFTVVAIASTLYLIVFYRPK